MVMALELGFELVGSIAALSSATLGISLTNTLPLLPSSIIWYRYKLGSKQAHHAIHWPRVGPTYGAWLRAIKR